MIKGHLAWGPCLRFGNAIATLLSQFLDGHLRQRPTQSVTEAIAPMVLGESQLGRAPKIICLYVISIPISIYLSLSLYIYISICVYRYMFQSPSRPPPRDILVCIYIYRFVCMVPPPKKMSTFLSVFTYATTSDSAKGRHWPGGVAYIYIYTHVLSIYMYYVTRRGNSPEVANIGDVTG